MPNKFTKTFIAAAVCPAGKTKVRIRDLEVPSLVLCVTDNGAKSFYFYKKIHSRVCEVRIGSAAECTIDQARRRAIELNAEYIAGRDPAAAKAAKRQAATLDDLWQSYLEFHAKLHKRPVSIAHDERMYKHDLAAWKNRPLNEITDAAVEGLKLRIGANSPASANRLLALLSCMFRKRGHAFGLPRNWTPTAGIERFKERARDRVLSNDEFAAVFQAIKAEENSTVRDYFLMLIYTGARRSNVAAMRWDDLNLEHGIWKIPGEVTKNGNALAIELVPEAVEILKKRPDDSPFVFPVKRATREQVDRALQLRGEGMATRKIAAAVGVSQSQAVRMLRPGFIPGEHGPFVGVRKPWQRILRRAGITERTTIHDIRRTFCSALVAADVNLTTIAAAMGHKTLATTQKHYAIARQSKVRDAVRLGVQTLLAANPIKIAG